MGGLQALALAFLLGLPTTSIFPLAIMPTPMWWRPEIALAALLSGMLLSAGL
jgi:hypothetical protein